MSLAVTARGLAGLLPVGQAEVVAGGRVEEAVEADHRAQESAGRDQAVGRGTVEQAGAVGADLEAGANLTRPVALPTRAEAGVGGGACSVCPHKTARQGRSRAPRSRRQSVIQCAEGQAGTVSQTKTPVFEKSVFTRVFLRPIEELTGG